jgi:hypothetical protein
MTRDPRASANAANPRIRLAGDVRALRVAATSDARGRSTLGAAAAAPRGLQSAGSPCAGTCGSNPWQGSRVEPVSGWAIVERTDGVVLAGLVDAPADGAPRGAPLHVHVPRDGREGYDAYLDPARVRQVVPCTEAAARQAAADRRRMTLPPRSTPAPPAGARPN